MPHVVAESAVDEVIGWLSSHDHKKQAGILDKRKSEIENHLVETLSKIYENNEKFRAKLKRIQRIDDLYVWIEHWLASYLNQNFHSIFSLLPRGYGWDVRLSRRNPAEPLWNILNVLRSGYVHTGQVRAKTEKAALTKARKEVSGAKRGELKAEPAYAFTGRRM
jgi:hypothetical protein